MKAKQDTLGADMSGRAMAKILSTLPAHLPISDAYEATHLPGNHWWFSQRQHVCRWLSEISGPGAYGRSGRGLGAKHAYNHFQCAPGLLWMAEALGEDSAVVQDAAVRAAAVGGRPASQCKAIREVVPWGRIHELAIQRARRSSRRGLRSR